MSWRFAQLALAALLGFASPAIAADRAQQTCEQSKRGGQDWDKQIIGCSALLSRSSLTNGDRSITLENRAFANEGKGDHDRAIADYDEAIRLEPNNASAYAARGRVFEKKGDPRRALADFNKALTLESDLPGAIAGRDRVRAALAAVPGAETPAAAPTPVAAAPPASQAPSIVLGNGDLDTCALVRRGDDPPRSEKCLGLRKARHDLRNERRTPTGLGGFQQGTDAAGRSFQRDRRARSDARRSGGGSRPRDARRRASPSPRRSDPSRTERYADPGRRCVASHAGSSAGRRARGRSGLGGMPTISPARSRPGQADCRLHACSIPRIQGNRRQPRNRVCTARGGV